MKLFYNVLQNITIGLYFNDHVGILSLKEEKIWNFHVFKFLFGFITKEGIVEKEKDDEVSKYFIINN